MRWCRPRLRNADFVKQLRKPAQLFDKLLGAVRDDFAEKRAVPRGDLSGIISPAEQEAYFETLLLNLAFSKPVVENFLKASIGLPLIGGAVYSHLFAGVGNHIMAKTGRSVEDSMKMVMYYRSPVIVEELQRIGYSRAEIYDIVAKNTYLQYWSGRAAPDPLVMGPMVRMYYPPESHVSNGTNDLGREAEMQAARLFCMGLEGRDPPVVLINSGDSGPFTDGAMHCFQHIIEAEERGYRMPIVFLVSANNACISTRMDDGDWGGMTGAKLVERRFRRYGFEGFVTPAEDVAAGMRSVRQAVDLALESGRPTFAISTFPFRPSGHASDASPANDALLLKHFDDFRVLLRTQLESAALPGTDVAARLDEAAAMATEAVAGAITGTNLMTRAEISELSTPGKCSDPGKIVDVPLDYFRGRSSGGFAGLGSDIFGRSLNRVLTDCDATGRAVRYVHQENHRRNKTDTRGGVYGELNLVGDEHLGKFLQFMPHEAQVVQVGMAMRSVLPENNLVFVKGPHTLFNEHARDHLKYAAYRHADSGSYANHIYIMDGGSLAIHELEQVVTKGGSVEREVWLARVGEHHNTNEYGSYRADANTVMAVPIDMNFWEACMPAMIRLHDVGRMVLGVVPTASFGMLHASSPVEKLGEHDTIRVKISGRKPRTGRKLVVVTWGPESKMVTSTLADAKVECEVLILSFMQAANSLTRFLDDLAVRGLATEVLCVDPNPDSALLGPVMSRVRQSLGITEDLIFSECTTSPAFVPHGNGNSLLTAEDLRTRLRQRGLIEGVPLRSAARPIQARPIPARPVEQRVAEALEVSPSISLREVVVTSPVEGEVVVKPMRQVGDSVRAGELLLEVENDKATVEVVAPSAGIVESIHSDGEITVEMTTTLCTLKAQGTLTEPVDAVTDDPVATDEEAVRIVHAPMDASPALITFHKAVGDSVKRDELIAEIESDKATIELNAPCSGVILDFLLPPGEHDLTTDTPIVELRAASEPVEVAAVQDLPQDTHVPLSRHQLSMVENMTFKPGDTRSFTISEVVDFASVMAYSRSVGVTPVVALVKELANSAMEQNMNRKLSVDKRNMLFKGQVDIGLAVDAEGQLRVAVVRNALHKSYAEISADIEGFVKKGAKLSAKDQSLENVCWVVTSLGKDAPGSGIPVLPRNCTGIVTVGRASERSGESIVSATMCHATLSGIEGTKIFRSFVDGLTSIGSAPSTDPHGGHSKKFAMRHG
jgi:pyruvate/2-oxoglutarate dehydrogenase complex dihydrolipoamide acyltransferase (E2) component